MPNDSGYVLDFETLQRISKSVREQERGVTKAGMADMLQPDQHEGTSFVEVTGAATTAGYYPAREKWYDIESNTWTYAQDSCVAWEMNGSTLDSGKTYKGTLARSVVEGGVVKHVFAVQASGGGGAAGPELVFVKSTGAASWYTTGVISTLGNAGSAIQPATWIDGTTVIGIQELNQNIIPTGKRMLAMKVTAAAGGSVYIVGLDPEAVTSVVCNSGTLTIKQRT
jgi:hypothetical protein